MDTEVSDFSYNRDLELKSRSSKINGIKLQSLVVSVIIPSLKEIGLQMFEHKPMLKLLSACLFLNN